VWLSYCSSLSPNLGRSAPIRFSRLARYQCSPTKRKHPACDKLRRSSADRAQEPFLRVTFTSASGHFALALDVSSQKDVGNGRHYKSWTLNVLVIPDTATVTLDMAAPSCYNTIWDTH
jgi:hypothetical protein